MPVDLPDLNFNERIGMMDQFIYTLDHAFEDFHDNTNHLRVNTQEDPIQIISEAFQKYIVNSAIQSNTVGINIIYLQNRGDTEFKNIFIAKRNYQSETTQTILENTEHSEYVGNNQIQNGDIFENNQIRTLLERLDTFSRIVQITVCEVYNDDPVSIQRRNGTPRGGGAGYYPFVIPIALLYRDIPLNIYRTLQRQREEQRVQAQIERMRRLQEPREIELQRMRIENLQVPGTHPELEEEVIATYNVNRPAEHTPRPLQVVEDPEVLYKKLTSYVWPGMCVICLESDKSDLCRVNCEVGHVFHCDCINEYRDTYTEYGWNNNCPVCRISIDKVVKLNSKFSELLPTSFGKKRSKMTLKQIEKLIKEIKLMHK